MLSPSSSAWQNAMEMVMHVPILRRNEQSDFGSWFALLLIIVFAFGLVAGPTIIIRPSYPHPIMAAWATLYLLAVFGCFQRIWRGRWSRLLAGIVALASVALIACIVAIATS